MTRLRIVFYLTLILTFSPTIQGQVIYQYGYNNIDARLSSDGTLFNDKVNALPAFEVPTGTGIHSIFSASLWVSGVETSSGSIYSSVNIWGDTGIYYTGPIANVFDATYDFKYNLAWTVNSSIIDQHKANWNQPGHAIHQSILDWPGNGDPSNGEASQLAPYADLNGNGLYEPDQGEYPCISGDEAVYMIFNDVRNRNSAGHGPSMGIEVHMMAYAIGSNDAFNNAIFVNYTIHNRSQTNYDSVRLGLFADTDIGGAEDDYIGCDSTLDLFFGYNGDSFDGPAFGSPGYGANPPATGIAFLNTPMTAFMYYNRGGGVTGDPQNPSDYHNYLNARWRDGSSLTYGGNGYMGTTPTEFMFPGDPNDTTQWSDIINFPFDRRGLGSAGPFTLNSGTSLEFNVAFVYSRSTDTSVTYPSVNSLKADVSYIKAHLDTLSNGCESFIPTGIAESAAASDDLIAFPVPTSDILYVNYGRVLPDQVSVVNVLGEELFTENRAVLNIDVSEWTEGIYFLLVRRGNELTTRRFMVRN